MKKKSVNDFGEDFSHVFADADFSMEDIPLELDIVNQSKLESRCYKNNFKYTRKIENDIEQIKTLINSFAPDEELRLISRAFDSPNILQAMKNEIDQLYVATWAITPAGISALRDISQSAKECWVLLDATHSYKWIFASGAIKILQGRVIFKFTANHSKFLALRLKDGSCLNVVGSMNLSNNPRWENMRMNKSEDEFNFLSGFVKAVEGKQIR